MPFPTPGGFVAGTHAECATRCLEIHLLAVAFEQVSDAVVMIRTEGAPPATPAVIAAVNPAFGQLTGFGAEETLGRSLAFLPASPADAARLLAALAASAGGAHQAFELHCRRRDGTAYLAEWTVDPVRDATGAVAHVIAVHRDVTERRRQEVDLRRTLATVREQAAGLADAVAVIERTKRNFRSSDLGFLRERLQRLLTAAGPRSP